MGIQISLTPHPHLFLIRNYSLPATYNKKAIVNQFHTVTTGRNVSPRAELDSQEYTNILMFPWYLKMFSFS